MWAKEPEAYYRAVTDSNLSGIHPQSAVVRGYYDSCRFTVIEFFWNRFAIFVIRSTQLFHSLTE